MRYRVIVQREVRPGVWTKEWSIQGPAEDPTAALGLALAHARHPSGKRKNSAPNWIDEKGPVRYPNITVVVSDTQDVFTVLSRTRVAMREANVAPSDVTRFITECGGRESGLQKISMDYAKVVQVAKNWVTLV